MEFLDRELLALRPSLLRFARMQVHDSALAEDLVSATLLAILERPDAFRDESSLRTYAFGILRNKLIDDIRRRKRVVAIDVQEDESIDDALDALFDQSGHWREEPAAWIEPERALENAQLVAVLDRCLQTLPQRLSHALVMREVLDTDTDVLCADLQITPNNCNVMLYRARMLMRSCLELHWFGGKSHV